MKKRYIIKHIPTDKVYTEDEGGVWLVERDDSFTSFGRKEEVDDLLVIRKNVEDYIKLMEMISDIQESSKDIKSSRQRLRDIKLEKILN